jgi:hypothetical protein
LYIIFRFFIFTVNLIILFMACLMAISAPMATINMRSRTTDYTAITGTCFIQKIYAPPLPYFKLNICPFPLPHFGSIFFAYLWSFRWPNYIVKMNLSQYKIWVVFNFTPGIRVHGTGVSTKNAGADKKSTNRVYICILFLDIIIFSNEIIPYNNCVYNKVFTVTFSSW